MTLKIDKNSIDIFNDKSRTVCYFLKDDLGCISVIEGVDSYLEAVLTPSDIEQLIAKLQEFIA